MIRIHKDSVLPNLNSLTSAVRMLIQNQIMLMNRLDQLERGNSLLSIDSLPYSKELKANGFETIEDIATALENGLKPVPGLGEKRLKHIQSKIFEILKN